MEQAQHQSDDMVLLAEAVKLFQKNLREYLDNPFLPIDEQLARRCERHADHRKGWMDEQHVEDDPLCMAFPEDMRELMMLYSGKSEQNRRVILTTLKAMVKALSRED